MNIMYDKYVRNLRHCQNVGETLARSDENFCKKKLAITDLANTDFQTLTRSEPKKNDMI